MFEALLKKEAAAGKGVKKEEETLFKIELQKEIPSLPDFKTKEETDIRYPLIEPYAYVHIYWNTNLQEVMYEVEEPKLDPREKNILKIVEDGIKELINISFISIKEGDTVIRYLEKNIKILLAELGFSLSKETFLKVMYYVYRDFVGLNEFEPLMNDYFIEDIECNGINSPVYLVHRKYRNLKTNINFTDVLYLASFVEKLAQKCGRYVSYSSPLLDGSLPSGHRVNATYTTDISSKGPTITIRAFTKEPWSPSKMIDLGTVSPEILAYLWMLVEHEFNIMVIGGTGSGKCVTGNTPVYLSNGKRINIKDLVESKFKTNKIKHNDGWEFVEGDDTTILSLGDNLKISKKPVGLFWRHKAPNKLIKITTRSGRSITTTFEHPFFKCQDGRLIKIRADELTNKERIAVPRFLSFYKEYNNENLMNSLKNEKDIYVYNQFDKINKIYNLLGKKYNCSRMDLAKKLGYSTRTFRSWSKDNSIPISEYTRLLQEANLSLEENLFLKAKTTRIKCRIPKINPELFRFLALIIGDGHLAKTHVELHNSNINLLKGFLKLGENLFDIKGKIKYPKGRVSKAIICSSILCKILNKLFQIPYGNKAKIVAAPNLLFSQDEKCISEFLSGIIDCEAYISKNSIELSSVSEKLSNDISTLFLRLGILSNVTKRPNHFRINIYGYDNIDKLNSQICLKEENKLKSLNELLNRNLVHKTVNLDVTPNLSNFICSAREGIDITQGQLAQNIGVSRRLVGMWENGLRNPTFVTLNKLSSFIEAPELRLLSQSDILWDQVADIDIINNHKEEYVYDLTVNDTHNFIAGDIPLIAHNTSFLNALAFFIPQQARIVSIEDTKELNIVHENWLPSVAREGIGLANIVGQKYGEVTLFDLLKESFRQRPDYVIIGEVRGKEAFVLFQGMASGHPSLGTMHANDVQTMIRRLETEPINLSPSLVESMDAICVMTQAKLGNQEVRRLKQVVEIISVPEEVGKAQVNIPFQWDPRTDTFFFKTDSYIFQKLTTEYGFTKDQLVNEFELRTRLLYELYQKKIFDFRKVQEIINEYARSPKKVLKDYGLIK